MPPITPNPTTTEWVPLWDLNGVLIGSTPLHHTTHEIGGTDIITITALGGYPGGTTNFLRADGTFATPVTGVPGLHHTTHELGGSDVILNNAWTHVTNIFLANQIINKVTPRFQLFDTAQVADAKIFDIVSFNQHLIIQALNDVGSISQGSISISRIGDLEITGSGMAKGIRPTWALQYPGNTVISRVEQVVVGNRIDISSNLFYDGTNWNADDTTKVSALYIQQDGIHYLFNTTATTNPRTLVQLMTVSAAGAVIPAGLGNTPLNATNLTSGTVPLARLPASVVDQAVGLWVPVIGGIDGDSGDQTYQSHSQQGIWIRTGKLVHLWSFTQFTSKGTSMTGDLVIKNFPIPVGSSLPFPPFVAGTVSYYTNLNTGINTTVTGLSCYAPFGQSYALIKKHILGANNPLPLVYADINNATQLIISISYYVD